MNRRVAGRVFGSGVAALAAFAVGQTTLAAESSQSSRAETSAASAALPREAIKAATALRDAALASDHSYQLLESLTTEVGARFAGTIGYGEAPAMRKAKLEKLLGT